MNSDTLDDDSFLEYDDVGDRFDVIVLLLSAPAVYVYTSK